MLAVPMVVVANCALVEKRFVDDATVEKSVVVVAFTSVVLPVTAKAPPMEVFPAASVPNDAIVENKLVDDAFVENSEVEVALVVVPLVAV